MLCQNCNEREAQISITQIVNNKKTQIHLCNHCAQQKGHVDPMYALHKMLAGMMDWNSTDSTVGGGERCSQCGLTEHQLRQNGRFGCQQCYQTWEPLVNQMLSRVHGGASHTGKVPNSAGQRVRRQREVSQLKQKLKEAVAQEKFELAAELRDKIRDLGGENVGSE